MPEEPNNVHITVTILPILLDIEFTGDKAKAGLGLYATVASALKTSSGAAI